MPEGNRIDPTDERSIAKAKVRRIFDPLAFCPECGHDTNVETTSRENGITFTETGERARVGICRSCRIIWSERTPLGQEMRAELGGGKRRTSISVPGAPTRPYRDERLDLLVGQTPPQGPVQKAHTGRAEGPTDTDRAELLHYDRCRIPGCGECARIESVWNARWARGIAAR